MKVLDSTFLVDMVNGEEDALKILNSNDVLLTTQVNMYEFLVGLFLSKITQKKFWQIREMFEDIRVLPLDEGAVIRSAEISSNLRRKGNPTSDCDCMIAGIALSHGINAIVTRNEKHFRTMKDIKVETY